MKRLLGYLSGLGHSRRSIEVYVPLYARTQPDIAGAKDAYYTAGHGPMTSNFRGLNHTMTYVVDGKQLGFDSDLLVGTGNSLISLPQAILLIGSSVQEEKSMKFIGTKLSKSEERRVLAQLGLKI